MRPVISVSLNGLACQREDDGHAAFTGYLDSAERSLAANPDRSLDPNALRRGWPAAARQVDQRAGSAGRSSARASPMWCTTSERCPSPAM